jgi:hypothetical protein
MGLIKHILLGNFCSFLLILSGIVDIAIGVLILTGAISVKGHTLAVLIICFVIGFIYFAAGLAIAIVTMKRRKD